MPELEADGTDTQTIIEDAAAGAGAKTGAEAGGGGEADAGTTAPAKTGAEAGTTDKTLAQGGEAVKVPVTATFPDNWRDILAGEDKKARKALDRFTDPGSLWKSYREADARINSGELVKVPGKKATDEERAAFNKALGVPETPAEYIEKLKLAKGRELGDDDRPVIESFAAAMHPLGATPAQISAATNWWFDVQQAKSEQQEQEDADFRVDSEVALKQELGGNFSRATNAIGVLFESAPSGVMDLLLNGRTADGHKFGDHPEIVKWLANVALEINPSAGQHAPDGNTMQALEDELNSLRKLMGNDKSEYWEGPMAKKNQARMAELLIIKEKMDSRRAA